MPFLSFFRAQLPNVLTDLKVICLELTKARSDLERLFIMEQNYVSRGVDENQFRFLMRTALDCYGVAIWVKDENCRFLYVNSNCCKVILGCTEEEALGMTDDDFKQDALATICIESDKQTMFSKKTQRRIEHARYPNGKDVFLDVVKSPRIEEDRVVGTIGSAVDITRNIPEEIREKYKVADSIEIPLNAFIGVSELVDLLEMKEANGRK